MGPFLEKIRRCHDELATAVDAFCAVFENIHRQRRNALSSQKQTRAADDMLRCKVPGTNITVIWVIEREFNIQVWFDGRWEAGEPCLQLTVELSADLL